LPATTALAILRTVPQRRGERRLTTVLFLDIVGSTRIAAEIGDRRWRDLLGRFRGIVRAQLKRHGGHEEDTAGDGFLATFTRPIDGVEAAGDIAAAVQEIGLEVRSGVHTGEVEELDGKLAGIGVHLAARVRALAGPAQTLVTGTVRDLVIGSAVDFAPFGTHELKGVPGSWPLHELLARDGSPSAAPLEEAEATRRIQVVEPVRARRRRHGLLVGVALVVVLAVVGAVLVRATVAESTITLIRLDPQTGAIVQTLRDRFYSHHLPDSLWAGNGSLWQYVPFRVVRRDGETGAPRLSFAVPKTIESGAPGFNSVWIATTAAGRHSTLLRYDEASGTVQARIDIPIQVVSISASPTAVWVLGPHGTLVEIDPLGNRVSHVDRTAATAPGRVVAVGDSVWICDCENGRVYQVDTSTGRQLAKLSFPEHAYLLNVDEPTDHTVWLVDPNGNTLTPVESGGTVGQPIGFGGHVASAAIGFGAVWVAASNSVYRVDLVTHRQQRIEIPADMTAGSVAVDERDGSVWIGNCGCPRNG
jgi:class 3 adenylate cyclase